MELRTWGWDAEWEKAFNALADKTLFPARIIEKHRRAYLLATESGERIGQCRRTFLDKAEAEGRVPALGDWVAAEAVPGEDKAIVRAVLPGRGRFARKKAGKEAVEQVVAANIDVAFLVAALGQEFNPRRLERYLALACSSGVEPVILLNKADRFPSPTNELREAAGLLDRVAVHAVSATTTIGLDRVRAYLSVGRTAAFLGSSGVGKSSLINALLGKEEQAVGEVRGSDERGRHTTSAGRLLLLPTGGVLVDTAGMREIQLWDSDEGVVAVFQEIDEAAQRCRFRDCAHDREPNCAVRQALKDGQITLERFESWKKLGQEQQRVRVQQANRKDVEQKQQAKRRTKALNDEHNKPDQ